MSWRGPVRAAGEVLLTLGVLVLLFGVYDLVWTNVTADRAADRVVRDLERSWRQPPAAGQGRSAARSSVAAPGAAAAPNATGAHPSGGAHGLATPGAVGEGGGFAVLRIPRLGRDWVRPVVEGVGAGSLARGVGHYPGTALPGAVGNFAVAGHRATHGEPFRDLDRLAPGDAVVVRTRDSWLTYRVDAAPGGRGWRIVRPSATGVLAAVPERPAARPTGRLMTLTTCHPRWASTSRLVVLAHLVSRQPVAGGLPPALGA